MIEASKNKNVTGWDYQKKLKLGIFREFSQGQEISINCGKNQKYWIAMLRIHCIVLYGFIIVAFNRRLVRH